jgi:hypothetical protein
VVAVVVLSDLTTVLLLHLRLAEAAAVFTKLV